jgi:iron complex transport system substrate-binding protein
VNEETLKALNPDLIITQDHCEVCAASVDEVKKAVQTRLGDQVNVLSVSPTDLSSVVDSIRTIAQAIEAEEAAETVTEKMKSRLQEIQQKTAELSRPEVLGIEWMDPLMTAGNWVPELIQLAGGNPMGATAGKHSPKIRWQQICDYNPDIITIMPCGYSNQQTLSEISDLTSREGWNNLRAVRNNQVYILDGNQYFNRPGPRLVDSTQILAEVIHPSIFRKDQTHRGWINLWRHQFQENIRSYA